MSNESKLRKMNDIFIHVPLKPGEPCTTPGCPCVGEPNRFPSHTHGMEKIGLLEILFEDHKLSQNDQHLVLNASMGFFEGQREKVQQIVDGTTLVMPGEEVTGPSDSGAEFTFGYRLLSPNNPLVREAYPESDGMWVIGITVTREGGPARQLARDLVALLLE